MEKPKRKKRQKPPGVQVFALPPKPQRKSARARARHTHARTHSHTYTPTKKHSTDLAHPDEGHHVGVAADGILLPQRPQRLGVVVVPQVGLGPGRQRREVEARGREAEALGLGEAAGGGDGVAAGAGGGGELRELLGLGGGGRLRRGGGGSLDRHGCWLGLGLEEVCVRPKRRKGLLLPVCVGSICGDVGVWGLWVSQSIGCGERAPGRGRARWSGAAAHVTSVHPDSIRRGETTATGQNLGADLGVF